MTIVMAGGGESPIAPTWVPLSVAMERAASTRERSQRRAADIGQPVGETTRTAIAQDLTPTWSAPDADGWCYAIDIDGREHARHSRHLRDPALQRLDETEAAYEARLAVMTRGAELAEAESKIKKSA